MAFPIDLLANVEPESLEQSAKNYMCKLQYRKSELHEYFCIPGSKKIEIGLCNVGFVPLYGVDIKHKILALFSPEQRFKAVGLYLLDQWWSAEDILKTVDVSRTGLIKVRTTGERIVLYVLNRIIYRTKEMVEDNVLFLCHGEDEIAKILWKNGEAIGFYSVKPEGRLCKSFLTQCYQLPVMDTIFIRKSHRGNGYGLQMLEDFVHSFRTDFMGLEYPLSPAMYKVCQKYLSLYPEDTQLLYEITGVGSPFERTQITRKLQAMNLKGKRQVKGKLNFDTEDSDIHLKAGIKRVQETIVYTEDVEEVVQYKLTKEVQNTPVTSHEKMIRVEDIETDVQCAENDPLHENNKLSLNLNEPELKVYDTMETMTCDVTPISMITQLHCVEQNKSIFEPTYRSEVEKEQVVISPVMDIQSVKDNQDIQIWKTPEITIVPVDHQHLELQQVVEVENVQMSIETEDVKEINYDVDVEIPLNKRKTSEEIESQKDQKDMAEATNKEETKNETEMRKISVVENTEEAGNTTKDGEEIGIVDVDNEVISEIMTDGKTLSAAEHEEEPTSEVVPAEIVQNTEEVASALKLQKAAAILVDFEKVYTTHTDMGKPMELGVKEAEDTTFKEKNTSSEFNTNTSLIDDQESTTPAQGDIVQERAEDGDVSVYTSRNLGHKTLPVRKSRGPQNIYKEIKVSENPEEELSDEEEETVFTRHLRRRTITVTLTPRTRTKNLSDKQIMEPNITKLCHEIVAVQSSEEAKTTEKETYETKSSYDAEDVLGASEAVRKDQQHGKSISENDAEKVEVTDGGKNPLEEAGVHMGVETTDMEIPVECDLPDEIQEKEECDQQGNNLEGMLEKTFKEDLTTRAEERHSSMNISITEAVLNESEEGIGIERRSLRKRTIISKGTPVRKSKRLRKQDQCENTEDYAPVEATIMDMTAVKSTTENETTHHSQEIEGNNSIGDKISNASIQGSTVPQYVRKQAQLNEFLNVSEKTTDIEPVAHEEADGEERSLTEAIIESETNAGETDIVDDEPKQFEGTQEEPEQSEKNAEEIAKTSGAVDNSDADCNQLFEETKASKTKLILHDKKSATASPKQRSTRRSRRLLQDNQSGMEH